jgi:hypothetical protein
MLIYSLWDKSLIHLQEQFMVLFIYWSGFRLTSVSSFPRLIAFSRC